MIRKKVEAIKVRYFKSQLKKIVKRHKKALVIFKDCDGDLRKRLITDNGSCTVSYKGSAYRKWSGFTESCFMEYKDDEYDYRWDSRNEDYNRIIRKANIKNLANTLNALVAHDYDNDVYPLEIRYGKGLKKTVIIQGEY